MEEVRLIEVGLADKRWNDDALWAVYGAWDLKEVAEEEAEVLRNQVLEGEITVAELRAGVTWANALDRESVEAYGADLNQGGQKAERTARRLMHLAGRSALNSLKSRNARTIRVSQIYMMLGMAKLETHDMKDRNLVQ